MGMDKVLSIAKALSDANRLRILMSLEAGPLCLCQVTDTVALSASTVSKHLHILASAGLVEKWQEGRWHYFSWVRDAASSFAGSLYAWLRAELSGDSTIRSDASRRAVAMQNNPAPCPRGIKPKVLFLCTGNSCRSQMAEALLRKHAADMFDVYSAGLAPQPISPLTYTVMKEAGLGLEDQEPKSVLDYLGRTHFAYLITVCANAESRCPIFPGASYRLYWPFEDPGQATGTDAQRLQVFRRVRDAIEEAILSWLAEVTCGKTG